VPEKGATPARANPHAQTNTPPTSHGANGGGRRDEQEHPGCWERVCSALDGLRQSVLGFAGKLAKIAREDPRRVAHALQVGLALTLVSVLYYVAPLFRGFGVSTLWAVLTVVVVTGVHRRYVRRSGLLGDKHGRWYQIDMRKRPRHPAPGRPSSSTYTRSV
jgi:hypothetical protein